MALNTFYVRVRAVFTCMVPVAATSPEDAVTSVMDQGEGDWMAYEPLFDRKIPSHELASIGYGPAQVFGLIGRSVPSRYQTTFQALVSKVRELPEDQWQLLVAERTLCRSLEGL